jgi:Na+/H+-translocating membrane pyrophosphatase
VLIGGSIAFLFSGLAIRAVGSSAGTVVQEVRRQFREHPGIMDYTEKPEYGRVISICTAAAQRELATPALLAVLAPVIVGFGINYFALGAFLVAAILTGQLMANTLSNSGGAWDNAKKFIEDGTKGEGLRGPQGRGHRRHRRRPVQGHRWSGTQPADQGHEPRVAADLAGGHHLGPRYACWRLGDAPARRPMSRVRRT